MSSAAEDGSKRGHRILVGALIALASLLLVLSITANWIQRSLLDTEEVEETTSLIVADRDVQQQLSIFLVDQLYANVDVPAEIEKQLPDPAKPFAAPAGAAVRQLATEVSEKALESPQFQELVTTAVGRGHEQFVALIRDESQYVTTTPDGQVTLDYGDVVAQLATRLGVDPAAITEIQSVVQDFAGKLREGLTATQDRIKSVRAQLAQVEGGELSTELQQGLEDFEQNAADVRERIAGVQGKIEGVESKVPAPLQGRLQDLADLLGGVEGRVTKLKQLATAVLEQPRPPNLDALDTELAALETRVTDVLERPVVQNPGELVVMDSSQLDGVQSLVAALRNLGIVLPLLALGLYLLAIYLAKGWRPRALITAGAGILVATLLVLLVRRVIGGEVVSALAGSETVEPAISSVWEILSGSLRERGIFVLTIGLAFIAAGLLAGPGRHSTATRRFLAPYLDEHPALAYSVVVALFLLWLTLMPGLDNIGQVLVIVLLAVLALVGVAMLRRQTAREFPPAIGPN